MVNLFVRSAALISEGGHQQNPLRVPLYRIPGTGDPWEQRSAGRLKFHRLSSRVTVRAFAR
jgi:hypothetical protein